MGAITPRPVAFVSTLSADGVHNLAPFSFFNIVSADPPTIVVSVAPSDGSLKGGSNTARNILDTKSFAVSIISEPWVEAANLAALDAPPDVDEFALTGLTPRASEVIPAPHVAEAAFSVEAELLHHYTLRKADGSESNTVFLGSVKRIHAKEFIFDENDPYRVLTERLRPVSRLGGIAYGRVTEAYDLQRQRWEDIGESDDVKAALKGGKANGANGH
ncbi:hypothetical protein VHUM_01212 [Vanrija humicola]|uniref:Flavin reductase like domain-containing protein n=1 Tax=Vanrija humicola TaxID=5417 RepID=A0A7D8YXY6_VANHU|nr:hypothetical protein VHUM_01212 [Vanrija humicola]